MTNCIPEWLAYLVVVFMWAHGFVLAWAAKSSDSAFWRGFLDGLSLRFLWGRWVR